MKMKTTGGRIVHSPLSYSFTMLEMGGSGVQKYNTLTESFIPNRELTPLVLRPVLTITDPDGVMVGGDYSSYLINVRFRGQLASPEMLLPQAKPLSVDPGTNAVTIEENLLPGQALKIEFSADYVDKRRNEVAHFVWEKTLTCLAEVEYNLKMSIESPTKVNLSPFKDRGQFSIEAQLWNGEDKVSDAKAAYTWFYLDEGNIWGVPNEDCLWYVGGADTKSICVDQDYIQKIRLKCRGRINGILNQAAETKVVMLRRWYGMWEEGVDFVEGKYQFRDTNRVSLEAKVVNRQGNVREPEKYFDMELFFMNGDDAPESLGYGSGATVYNPNIKDGFKAGVLCRELSAWLPVELPDGSFLADDEERPIVVQVPTSEREVE